MIFFNEHGNTTQFISNGWSHPEPTLKCMIGFDSRLVVARIPAWERAYLRLDVMPHIRTHIRAEISPHQTFIAAANNDIVTNFEKKEIGRLECEIPKGAFGNKAQITLRLMHPDVAAPRTVADIQDDRPLAFAVKRLGLSRRKLPENGVMDDLDTEPIGTTPAAAP